LYTFSACTDQAARIAVRNGGETFTNAASCDVFPAPIKARVETFTRHLDTTATPAALGNCLVDGVRGSLESGEQASPLIARGSSLREPSKRGRPAFGSL